MIYEATFTIRVHANTEEDARDIIVDKYGIYAEDVEIICVGEE